MESNKSIALAIVICGLIALGAFYNSREESATLVWLAVAFLGFALLNEA